MRIKKLLLLCTFAVIFFSGLRAQDVHFSMYHLAPLTFNPAQTGAFEGTFRIGGIFRDQWYTLIPREFVTPSFHLDAPVIQGFGKNDWIGVGVMMFQDRVGAGNLSNGSYMFSAAYHLGLDKQGKSVLTLGAQGGLVQRRFDITSAELRFEDEIVSGVAQSSGDRSNMSLNEQYFDLRVGLMYKQQVNDGVSFNLGVAGLHLTNPRYALIQGGNQDARRLPFRIAAHGMLDYDINDKWIASPKVFVNTIGPAYEVNAQAWAGYRLKPQDELNLRFGLGYRWADAAMLLAGLDYKGFQAGLSYDFNVSDLSEATNFAGGFEIGVSYIAKIFKNPEVPPVIFCPQL